MIIYRPLKVSRNNLPVGYRQSINFVAGNNIEVNIIDNPSTDSVDVVISSVFEDDDMEYTYRIDETSSVGKTYIGKAVPDSLESDPVWQIKVIDETGDEIEILFADGDANFDNKWTERLTKNYS